MSRSPLARPHLRLVGGAAASDGPASGPIVALADDQLVRLMKEGDPGAFETLYRRHAAFAINLAVRIQGNANDVEDVVHDAFLRAAQRTDSLRDPSAFRSWLGSIVVRLVKTRLRRAKLMNVFGMGSSAQAEVVDLDLLVSSDAGPEARAELVQVYAVLLELPADDRIAWTLRYVEHHDLQGVSQLMNCSLATAKRRISRAQNHLLGTYGQDAGAALEPPASIELARELSAESPTSEPSS